MPRRTFRFSLISLIVLFATGWLWSQGQSEEHRPIVGRSVKHDVSPPLRNIPRRPPVPNERRVIPNLARPVLPARATPETGPDPLLSFGTPLGAPTPQPSSSFEGVSDDDNATGTGRVVPPDTQGDVGVQYYVQMINTVFAVFDKDGSICGSPGCVVPGGAPRPNNDLWQGFGGVCEIDNMGDPVVIYDHLANRWVFSQFGLEGLSQWVIGGDAYQCVAVSTTSDPLGSYYRYAFLVSPSDDEGLFTTAINDYAKLGVWEDAYYLTANEFQCPFIMLLGCGETAYKGAISVALERDKMLSGQSARFVKFGPASAFFSLQPSHLEGPAPPAGTPNTFVMTWDDEAFGNGTGQDGYRLWNFSVNWSVPGNSTFTSLGQVNTAEFDSNLCNYGPCVPQADSSYLLDTLSQFTMFRAQFRDFGSHQSMVFNHTVDLGGDQAGIRWAELRKLRDTGGGWRDWSLFQLGTYGGDSSDGLHRWMGSIAMDGSGNIALGYSVSDSIIHPEIRYTSRAASDPPGTMPGGEVTLHAGMGSQTEEPTVPTSGSRWGDYSSMSVDPVDDCTFWYTQEYYDCDPACAFDFKTRIGSFRVADCGTPGVCGNGIQEVGEACDLDDLGGQTCESQGFAGGTLSCDGSCNFDTGACLVSICGNGVIEGSEDCDGGDLGGQTCGSLGFDGGNLSCDGSCIFDTSDCSTCGNNIIEGSEICDGTDLGGVGCAECGTLVCSPDCAGYDTSGCFPCPSTCNNNGVCEIGEDCISCPSDCISGTTSGAVCGNGTCEVGDGEDCVTCPADCNGIQTGKPANRFCCGNGGSNPVGCDDAACTTGGLSCTTTPTPPGFYCCGDAACTGVEDKCSCSVDCGNPPSTETGFCADGVDNDCDTGIDCNDADCSSACQPVDCTQFSSKQTCNAQATCTWDNRNKVCVSN